MKSYTIYNKSEKIIRIRKILKQRRKSYDPFDNYAIIKKINNVKEFYETNKKLKTIGRNKLFNGSFPLLNIISNRKSLNHSDSLIQSILSEQDSSKSEINNLITNKIYNKPIKIYKGIIKKLPSIKLNQSLKEQHKSYIKKINETILIKPIKKLKLERNNSDISLSKELSLFYRKLKENYKKNNLKIHMINIKNQEHIKNKSEIGNYIINANKIRKKDDFLNLIRKDASTLKFNKLIKLNLI